MSDFTSSSPVMDKLCVGCNTQKSLNEFHKNKNELHGRCSYCKLCRKERSKAKRNNKKKDDTEGGKECFDCKQIKPYSSYCKDAENKDGCNRACKDCCKEKRD